jgi:SAM-dependent methyltransferase
MSEGHGLPLFVEHLRGWYAMTAFALAAQTGLLDALADGGTADEMSARAGVDRRNALECLRVLVASGLADADNGRFALTGETAAVLGPGFPVDARAVLAFVAGTAEVMPAATGAMRIGAGLPPELFQHAYGDSVSRINAPLYAQVLVDDWIAASPGLAEMLNNGARVAEVACGNGAAAALIGAAFPQSRVVGFDLDAAHQTAGLPANVELRAADVRELAADESFELVVCLDAFHHLGDPAAAAATFRRMLRPGGSVLIAESGLSGDIAADARNPFAVIGFGASLLYCLQENLAAGGPGVTAGDGPGWLGAALSSAGFSQIKARDTSSGYRVTTAVA